MKYVIVTGVSSGIGYQVAADLLKEGYAVIGVSRTSSDKVSVLSGKYEDRFSHEIMDLSQDVDSLSRWVVLLSKKYGKFSGLVHAAGVQQILPVKANSYSRMLEVFNINYFSAIGLAKGIADKRVHHENGASIVFISSIAAIRGSKGIVNYSGSKSALNGAMRSLAVELACFNVRVNAVLPGFVHTEMIDKWSDVYTKEYLEEVYEQCPLGAGKPEDVSNAVIFLIGDKSNWITGTELTVDGGSSLGDI